MEILTNHWLALIAIATAFLILWCVAVLAKYVRLLLNILKDNPSFLMMPPFDYMPIHGRQFRFRAFDGTKLRGMFLSKKDLTPSSEFIASSNTPEQDPDTSDEIGAQLTPDSPGLIIFCHEYGADMYSAARYCRPLLEAGFDIFTFDFRSHGHSGPFPGYDPRFWCTDMEVSDCLGALAFVESVLEQKRLNIPIGAFGISRGAGAAILTAAHSHSCRRIRAILSDSAFSTDITIEVAMKRWVHIFAKVRFIYENHHPYFWHFLRWLVLQTAGFRFHCRFPSVRKAVKRLKNTPLFLIHGEKDSFIRPDQAHAFFDSAPDPRYLWIAPKSKHNQSVKIQPEEYAEKTVAFFQKHLASKPVPKTTRSSPVTSTEPILVYENHTG